MKHLLHRFLPTLLLTLLLTMPASRGHAQWHEKEGEVQIDTTTAADDSEKEYGTAEKSDEEDTTTVETAITLYSRTIPADTIARYRASASFAWMSNLDSLLRAGDKARRNQPPPPPPAEEGPSLWDSGIVKLLCYLAAIGLVGFIIYKLFAGQGFLFARRKPIAAIPEVELDETADEGNLEKALRSAVAKKDYRLGVRYLFLLSLQRLGERGALQLSSEKTNYQYATELVGKSYAAKFAQLSLQYEYVWFGNFQISEPQFSNIQQQHQQFVKEV